MSGYFQIHSDPFKYARKLLDMFGYILNIFGYSGYDPSDLQPHYDNRGFGNVCILALDKNNRHTLLAPHCCNGSCRSLGACFDAFRYNWIYYSGMFLYVLIPSV